MKNLNLLLAIVSFIAISGCASMEEKLANKVGCSKEEAQVTRTMMVPAYEEYSVKCKNVVYSCKISPVTEFCNPEKETKK